MLLTILIVLLMTFVLFWKSGLRSKSDHQGNPFDILTTNTIKGICAIIVVMVHFPLEFSNPLQDAIGSFAYIAVTFFFFVSAYGMQYALINRENYFNNYWTNRLTALLFPMIIVNIVDFCLSFTDSVTLSSRYFLLYQFNAYVFVLLEYCLLFYICNRMGRYLSISQTWINLILILWVVGSSLTLYFLTPIEDIKMGWPYERLGLVWGLLTFTYKDSIVLWLQKRNVQKIFIFITISVVLGVTYLKFKSIFFIGEYLLKIVLGLSLTVLIFLIVTRLRVGNPISRILGNISYVIYLIHVGVMRFIAYLIPNADSGEMILTTYVVVLILSYPITLLSNWLINKTRRLISTFRSTSFSN